MLFLSEIDRTGCGLHSQVRETRPVFADPFGRNGGGTVTSHVSLRPLGSALTCLGRRGCISRSLPLDCTLIYDKNSFCSTALEKIFLWLVWFGSDSLCAVNTP